jgi:CheY-like chemotaxis protein
MTHIVIADPDSSIRNLLKQVVGLLGWTCDLAASGGEAWQLIKKTQPDLVIAEVEMSKMSGIELVGTMKYHSFLFHIPVIVISSPHQKIDALAAGWAAFVAKPFYVERLLLLLPSLVPERVTKSASRADLGVCPY